MPIDNDYFKNRQQQNQNNNQNKNGNNGGYEPPFSMPEFKGFGKNTGLIYGIVILVAIMFFAKPFVIINSGEIGLIKTLGKYDTDPLYPGFHLTIPVLQRVDVVDTKVRLINYKSSEDLGMGVTKDSGILVNPAINVLDARGLPVSIDMTVQYQLLPSGAPSTIATWGLSWEDKIINPVVRDIVRNVVGAFTAEDLPTKRNEVAVRIDQEIRKNIDALPNKPVKLLSVQLREIVLPAKVKEQIERVQIAKQEAQRVTEEVLKAKQEAEKAKAIAQGEADAKMIEATATAQANILVSKSLSPQLIQLKQVEVQGKFNEALKVNTNAQIFLTPGGSTPNIWVDARGKLLKQVLIINSLRYFHFFINYTLIGLLLLGLYFLWNENLTLKKAFNEVKKELDTYKKDTLKYQNENRVLKQNEKKLIEENTTLKAKQTNNQAGQKTSNQKVQPYREKKVILTLPEDEKQYIKVIPQIDYKDILLQKEIDTKTSNIKFNPEVFIDKENNKIEGGKLTIEKKF